MLSRHTVFIVLCWASLIVGVSGKENLSRKSGPDVHSYSNPQHIKMTHLDLKFDVDFERQILNGEIVLHLKRTSKDTKKPLILDTRHLRIDSIESSTDGKTFNKVKFQLGKAHPYLGSPLTIAVPEKVAQVRVRYRTTPKASGLQWLNREQTAGKRHPFLFTQSQAIHARSWIPLQDSPGVRVTYNATVKTSPKLFAVMSASNVTKKSSTGKYDFEMKQAIPAYLIALAVGDLTFKAVGPRTGVYSEPPLIDKSVAEFEDMEKMLKAVEQMYGPYRWERYDVLVLPPSFPFGGMENPRLTFATPTILAGDKSLVALIAHEMAHSWSGNLVSNSTWRDFWLNEGFTVYLERRIQEKIYGKRRALMEAALGRRDLESQIRKLDVRDQILHVDLKGRDPDEGFTDIPYEKGALFLKHLEKVFGRERFDKFLKSYFDHFAFQSITTADFVDYLDEHLLSKHPKLAARVPVEEWLYEAGIPKTAPQVTAEAFNRIENAAKQWLNKQMSIDALGKLAKEWTTQEWLHFLRALPEKMTPAQMQALDKAFTLTKVGNSEILFQWLKKSIQNDYTSAYERLEKFLTSMGRRKFLQPLFEELVKTPKGKKLAAKIYRKARPTYHPIAVRSVDEVLKWKE